jgi:maltose alpha-D-glucosyltransferase/alpha-amylase
MYMAVAQEDRHPITDIIRQTPEPPEGCQWAIFLRNHDELTLEMVTDEERDYLWDTYAADRRARINMGIRRRLAPLMQNDRRKIELLNSMLLSMPGTPVLYYGDEIGMGDNYYLGDRDGVRTPMQWSADRNAGFSRADPQRLFLPVIQDPVYGYESVNVEAQSASPSSYLNWMRRMVAVRKRHGVFGRGEIDLLYPTNRKILAYVRRRRDVEPGHPGDEAVLCVATLSRAAQAVELDLSRFKGRVPVELSGQSPFPPIGELTYLLTLPAYGFYWFLLAEEEEAPSWHTPTTAVLPDFLTLTTRDGTLSTALSGREGRQFEAESLPAYVALQRWFAGKGQGAPKASLHQLGEMAGGRHMLSTTRVETGGEVQDYFLPLSAVWDEDALTLGPRLPATLAKLRRQNKVGALVDGAVDEVMGQALLDALRAGADVGDVRFRSAPALAEIEDAGTPRLLSSEQSNASIAFEDRLILKLYRRIRPGLQPDIEIARFLTEETEFDATPPLLGTITLEADGEETVLGALSAYVPNQGDAWTWVLDGLNRELEARELRGAPEGAPLRLGAYDLGALLGQRTAELHQALASGSGAFAAEGFDESGLASLIEESRAEVAGFLDALDPDALPDGTAQSLARDLLARRDDLDARLGRAGGMAPSGKQTRIHGDYHLGQVLVGQQDVVIIDFEGEPSRTLEERQAKYSPLRDVAGMLRSFDYALWTALGRRLEAGADAEQVTGQVARWRDATSGAFLTAYRETMIGHEVHPEPDFEAALLDLFLIRKAAYEVDYERRFRPAWAAIPLRGLLAVLDGEAG